MRILEDWQPLYPGSEKIEILVEFDMQDAKGRTLGYHVVIDPARKKYDGWDYENKCSRVVGTYVGLSTCPTRDRGSFGGGAYVAEQFPTIEAAKEAALTLIAKREKEYARKAAKNNGVYP